MVVVVGGHSRNIGKTSLAAGLIRRLADRPWTALKITQYGHGVCSREGSACGCEADLPEHPVALTEEYEPGESDTGRFLAAGAARSYWLRTPSGGLGAARAMILKILKRNANVVVESNSVMEFVRPDVFLMLLDFSCPDFKPSSLRFMERADAFVVVDRGINGAVWEGVSIGRWDVAPHFLVKPPNYATEAVCGFVDSRSSRDRSAR